MTPEELDKVFSDMKKEAESLVDSPDRSVDDNLLPLSKTVALAFEKLLQELEDAQKENSRLKGL